MQFNFLHIAIGMFNRFCVKKVDNSVFDQCQTQIQTFTCSLECAENACRDNNMIAGSYSVNLPHVCTLVSTHLTTHC